MLIENSQVLTIVMIMAGELRWLYNNFWQFEASLSVGETQSRWRHKKNDVKEIVVL